MYYEYSQLAPVARSGLPLHLLKHVNSEVDFCWGIAECACGDADFVFGYASVVLAKTGKAFMMENLFL